MKVAIDLHIHSSLSPCSDNEMTPNNIAGMAYLKGLDFIAITDHNSVENFEAISNCAGRMNIVAVPGMEVETMEEVHLVCLFPGIEEALEMQKRVYDALPPLKNRADIFGEQVIMDEDDNIRGYQERMLITATNMGIEDVCRMVNKLGGVVIPAHVDRESYSIISNLGTIPENLDFKYLEISRACSLEDFLDKNPNLGEYSFIKSSDAHMLGNILEKQCFIDVDELSIKSLIRALKKV